MISKTLIEVQGIKYKEEWNIVYERVRFENDDRTASPLLIIKIITCINGNEKTLFDIKFYFCIFDFFDQRMLCKQKLHQPEFLVSYLRERDW